MNLRDRLTLSFTTHLATSPAGRAFVLDQIALAEGNGEARFFESILTFVDDPKLATMVRKHRDDEIRHEQLFLARRDATGVDPRPVPEHLRMMDRLDRALGGLLDRPVVDARGVMDAYIVLQVVEERALHQFDLLERAFRAVDSVTADTFVDVARDEERHLRYCQAIAKRYAPNERARTERLDAVRELEARVFANANVANMHYMLEHEMVRGSMRRFAWKMLGDFTARGSLLPYTEFQGAHDITAILARRANVTSQRAAA
jgi:rubrerythrin